MDTFWKGPIWSVTSNWSYEIGDRNQEGQRISLINFCLQSQLAVMNTFYDHKEQHKWTWYRWSNETQDCKDKSPIDLPRKSKKQDT